MELNCRIVIFIGFGKADDIEKKIQPMPKPGSLVDGIYDDGGKSVPAVFFNRNEGGHFTQVIRAF